jgi:hypothetical protein
MPEMQSGVATRFNVPWLRLLPLAAGAVYGPQLLMAGYTLCAVDCADCKATVWKLVAVTPGLELVLLPIVLLHVHADFGEMVNLAMIMVLSLLSLWGVTTMLRCRARWRWQIFGAVFLMFSLGAFLLLAAIRA